MLNLGIVDCDSSHSIEFARRINHIGADSDQFVNGARVTMACPGTSKMSPERVPKYTRQLADAGVEIVDRPEQMIGQIDGVLILSVAGEPHLERVQPFIEAGIPAFVDKPFSCSLRDAERIAELSEEHDVCVWSSSALRFSSDLVSLQTQLESLGGLNGAVTYGPAHRVSGNPGFFHYLIHPIEVLYTLFGTHCVAVSATDAEAGDSVTGVWADGRVGTVRGDRHGRVSYGSTSLTSAGSLWTTISTRFSYRNLCHEIIESIKTGIPAVPLKTTLEIVRFTLAANLSASRNGEPVGLKAVT